VQAGFGVATVRWELLRTGSKVEIYEAGQPVAVSGQIGETTFPVNPGQILDLRLEAYSELSGQDVLDLQKSSDIDPGSLKKVYEHLSASNIRVRVPASGWGSDSADAATVPDYSILRYQTFIPDAYVDAPALVCTPDLSRYRFVGDNRNWGPGATSFRTRFDVRVNWLDSGSMLATTSVGKTVREKQEGTSWVYNASDTASNASMILLVTGPQTSQYVQFTIAQDEKNPLCNQLLTLGISFNFKVSIWRNGSYELDGTAVKVPNHEIYIKDQDNPSWSILARRAYLSFDCLSPISALPCQNSASVIGVR